MKQASELFIVDIRLMAEVDEVIESHGGWPGAFQAVAPVTKAS